MFEDQKQEVGNNSVGAVAGRDVIQNIGLGFSDVKEIFLLLLKENFPIMREIAAETASKNVEKYLNILETKFAENNSRIDINKIKDPDVQYTFNEVVEANARKGSDVDADILSELLIERISIESSDILSIVSCEAIKIVPKLTSEHICFLSLVLYMSNIREDEISEIKQLEPFVSKILSLTKPGFDLSMSSIKYLEYIGVLSYSNFRTFNIIKLLEEAYPFIKNVPSSSLKELINKDAPSLEFLIEQFTSNDLCKVSLTTVGEMIGLASLKKVALDLDYRIWIN